MEALKRATSPKSPRMMANHRRTAKMGGVRTWATSMEGRPVGEISPGEKTTRMQIRTAMILGVLLETTDPAVMGRQVAADGVLAGEAMAPSMLVVVCNMPFYFI